MVATNNLINEERLSDSHQWVPFVIAISVVAAILAGAWYLANTNKQVETPASEITVVFDPAKYADQYQGSVDETVTVASTARVRNYPTTNGANVIQTLQAGEQLTGRWVAGVDPSTRWFRFDMDGDVAGYVWDGNLGAAVGNVLPDGAESALQIGQVVYGRSVQNGRAVSLLPDKVFPSSPTKVVLDATYSNANIGDEVQCNLTGPSSSQVGQKFKLNATNANFWCQFDVVPQGRYELTAFINGKQKIIDYIDVL
jgi:hypothetical protein